MTPTPSLSEIVPLVDRCLRRYSHLDAETRKDLYQEGLIAGWQKSLSDSDPGVLYRTIQCQMIDYLRKFGRLVPGRSREKGKRPLPTIVPLENYTLSVAPSFAAEIEKEDLRTKLAAFLTPDEQRLMALILNNVPLKKIAATLSVSRAGVVQKKARLLEKITHFRSQL